MISMLKHKRFVMRFLIPIVVIILTSVFVPRGADEEQAEAGLAPYAYPEKEIGAASAASEGHDDEYDVLIESSGMLNRLELLNF